MSAIIVALVDKMGHQNQDVDRAPTDGKERDHGNQILLRSLLFPDIQLSVVIILVLFFTMPTSSMVAVAVVMVVMMVMMVMLTVIIMIV